MDKAIMNLDYSDVYVDLWTGSYWKQFSSKETAFNHREFTSVSITTGCMSDDFFSYGTVYEPSATIEMEYDAEFKQGSNIRIRFDINGQDTWFGYFVVDNEPTYKDNTMSLTCVSDISSQTIALPSNPETSDGHYTLADIRTILESNFGMTLVLDSSIKSLNIDWFYPQEAKTDDVETPTIDGGTVTTTQISYVPKEMSCRDLLSIFCLALGCVAVVRVNEIFIVRPGSSDETEDYWAFDEDTYSGIEIAARNATPNPIKLTTNEQKITYQYNVDDNIQNYLAIHYDIGTETKTSTVLDVPKVEGNNYELEIEVSDMGDLIYQAESNFSLYTYRPMSLTFVGWNDLLVAGKTITVEYEGVEYKTILGNVTYHWDGGFTIDVESPFSMQGNGGSVVASATTTNSLGSVHTVESGLNNLISHLTDVNATRITATEASIDSLTAKAITVDNLDANVANIGYLKTSDLDAENAKIGYLKTSNLDAEVAKVGYLKTSDLDAETAKVGYLKADDADLKFATIENLNTTNANVSALSAKAITTDNLDASVANVGYLKSDDADLKFATIENLEATDGKIDTLSAKSITTDNITAEVAKLGYAKVDFSNVTTQVVGTDIIKDGAITDAKIGSLSANKITSGEIDASKVTVSNLNASNINTGTLTVGGVTLNIKDNTAEIDGSDIKDGTVTLEGLSTEVKDAIDGAIETFTTDTIPTLSNYPTNTWESKDYDKHIGDVTYIVNPASSADGFCYRFAKDSDNNYSWVLIKDSDVTKALQELIKVQSDVSGLKTFESTTSAWITNTDEELSSIKNRTTTLETTMGTKVDSSVFNEVKQTVDENSSNITSLTTTVNSKADGSVVENLSNTVNEVKQTSDSNTSKISSVETKLSNLQVGARNLITNSETLASAEHALLTDLLEYNNVPLTYNKQRLTI